MWFIYIANLNGTSNWYARLMPYYLPYYCVLIALSWYMSINVLLRTLLVSVKFYKILDFDLFLSVYDNDGCCGLKKFFNTLSVNIGIAFYFVMCIAIIIMSDFRAINYGIENAFYKYPIVIVLIVFILMFYLGMVLLSFLKAKNKVNDLVNTELTKYKYPDNKIDELMKIKYSMYSSKNIIFPVLTNAIPIVIAIISNIL